MPDTKALALGEVYFGNWLVMRVELTDEQLKQRCAGCTFSRECHVGDGATCPSASGEALLCLGFVAEAPH